MGYKALKTRLYLNKDESDFLRYLMHASKSLYNEGFKDINLSKQYNQMAKSIPLAKLRDRISYLAKSLNIEVLIINEAYTSKASYIDNDILPELDYKKHIFSGRRVKRGLYLSKEGIRINADLNAALNILRKGNPDAERIGNRG